MSLLRNDDYRNYFNLTHATFERINHDKTMMSVVYKVTAHQYGDDPLIVKIVPREKNYIREVYFLNYFATKLPVPRLIDTVSPSDQKHGALLMQYIPGNLLSEVQLSPTLALQAGTFLAKIHNNQTNGYGEATGGTRVTDPHAYLLQTFEADLIRCSQKMTSQLLKRCRAYVKETHELLKVYADGPCVVHRDFKPGNIIINNNSIAGIIDWGSARLSCTQEDFVFYEWPDDPTIKAAFYDGYKTIRPLPELENTLPLLRIIRAINVISFLIRENQWDAKSQKLYEENSNYLALFLQ